MFSPLMKWMKANNILPRISIAILEQLAEDDLPSRFTLGADENGEFTFEFSRE